MSKYKAVLFDVDGTLMANHKAATVSPRVIQTIAKAQEKLHIGIATSRPPQKIEQLVKDLHLSGPSIVYGGARIIDAQTTEVLWEQCIAVEDAQYVLQKATDMNIVFYANDDGQEYKTSNGYSIKKPISYWGHGITHKQLEEFHQTIKHLPNVSLHPIPSWQDGKIDFIVTHTAATKQHAIVELSKLLRILPEEMIGVGDGQNDLPLLMSVGLKVTMGNADESLKQIADYVAPSVDEDGAADVLEKFVLSQ